MNGASLRWSASSRNHYSERTLLERIPVLVNPSPQAATPVSWAQRLFRWTPDKTPAVRTIEGPYTYFATSPWWNKLCRRLPCLLWLDWPAYANAVKVVTVGQQTIIIHCWKGWCLQFLPGLFRLLPGINFPGGIGAEVGIYTFEKPAEDAFFPRREPEPTAAPEPERDRWWERAWDAIRDSFTRARAHAKSPLRFRLWWPASSEVLESIGPVSFSLYNRHSGDALIKDYETASYWTCKWMKRRSFHSWRADRSGSIRKWRRPEDFELRFTVAGVDYVWGESTKKIMKVPAVDAA